MDLGAPQPLDRRLAQLVDGFRFPEEVLVTRPSLPSRARFDELLDSIWHTRWLTNRGSMHVRLEEALSRFLGVEHVSLISSGTTALLIGLRALGVTEGEVITTPFSFPATAHAVAWSGLQVVFADIEPTTCTLDPARVEERLTSHTRAILPVHTYGSPCDLDRMEALARDHGLRLLYDGAHTFGVRHEGRALSSWGEATTLSFHATKPYSTVEGGALVCSSRELKEEADRLANFCILDEERVAGIGINGKLNEVLCAYGLAALEDVDDEIQRRRRVAAEYREGLREVPGLSWLPESDTTATNGAYFPVLVDPQEFGVDRDELHRLLRQCNVVTRKYFHPLLSHCRPYCDLPSAEPGQLPVAERVAERVLCLPIHGSLDPHVPTRITELLRQVPAFATGG